MSKLSVQDAVRTAKQFLLTADPDDPPQDVRLEEIAPDEIDSHKAWAVTLGLFRKRSLQDVTTRSLFPSFSLPEANVAENRIYKTVYIDQDSGDFLRMDIRKL